MANIVLYDENKNGHTGADAIMNLYSGMPDSPDGIRYLLSGLTAEIDAIKDICLDISSAFSSSPNAWSESLSETFYDRFNSLYSYFNNLSNQLNTYSNSLSVYS